MAIEDVDIFTEEETVVNPSTAGQELEKLDYGVSNVVTDFTKNYAQTLRENKKEAAEYVGDVAADTVTGEIIGHLKKKYKPRFEWKKFRSFLQENFGKGGKYGYGAKGQYGNKALEKGAKTLFDFAVGGKLRVGTRIARQALQWAAPYGEDAVQYVQDMIDASMSDKSKAIKIGKEAEKNGYGKITGGKKGSPTWYPIKYLKKDKYNKWTLKDEFKRGRPIVEIKFDDDGVPISHTETLASERTDQKGRFAYRDKDGTLLHYTKKLYAPGDAPGLGGATSVKNLEVAKAKKGEIRDQRIKEENSIIKKFYADNPQLVGKANMEVISSLQELFGPYTSGSAAGTTPSAFYLRERVAELGFYEPTGAPKTDEFKKKIKDYLSENDNYKTKTNPTIVADLNLQNQVDPSTVGYWRRDWKLEKIPDLKKGKNLSKSAKDFTSILKSELKQYDIALTPGLQASFEQSFKDYITNAFPNRTGRHGKGFTQNEITEGFIFFKDILKEGGMEDFKQYASYFESNQDYNEQVMEKVNAQRAKEGKRPLNQRDGKIPIYAGDTRTLNDILLTMGHARWDTEEGQMGGFDFSKMEPETIKKNFLALKLGKKFKKLIINEDKNGDIIYTPEEQRNGIEEVMNTLIEEDIRQEIILPNGDTFVVGRDHPNSFFKELPFLKKGGLVKLAAGGPVPEDPEPIEETEEVSFVDKMKNVLFPSSFEYPYKVSNEPLERGFIEDIENTTPEQRIKIYKNIRLQPLEDAIKEFKDKNRTSVTNENLSEEARQYLFSKKTVDDQETLFRSRVNAASMCQPTPDDPWCRAVFPGGVPDILDLAEEFDTFKATDINYKTMTERARGEGLYEETTKKAKQEILANQIKNTPAHVADLMLDFYQILSPPALVSGEMMHLDEIKKGQYVEKEDIGEYVAQVSPGLSEEFKDALIKTYTQMYDDQGLRIVPSGAAGPREPTGWERAKAYGLSAASIGTLFMKPNYVSRIGEVLSRKDIGKWGKTLSIAPKLLGVPSKKEVIGLLKLLKDGAWGTLKAPVKIPYKGGRYLSATIKPGTEGTFYVGNKTLPELGVSLPASELAKRANLTQMIKNIDIILGEMASEKSAERQKISEKEYQSNIANEVRNPQYTNEIKVLYEDALRTKLYDPNEILGEEEDVDVLDMLSKSTDFENLPDWVVRYARDMADDYIDINKLKKSTIGDTLFYDMFNKKKMAVGGDPNDAGMFTDPLRMGDDDTVDIDEYIQGGPYLGIDELDIFEESKKQVPTIPNQQDSIFDDEASFEVAGSIFGSAPGWAVAGVNKVDNLFRAGKTGQRIAQADKIADASKTVGEKINRFYSGLEARLIDPNTPDVFNTPADLFNFLNSKGISKLEAEDYQLPQLIATLTKTNEPITKAKLLDRIKIAPIRNLETKTQGFRSEIINGDGQFVNAKFSKDYYEPGSIPDTYRNTILYIDPKNLPRDVKAYKYSDHGFFPDDEVKYVIGWSRATDRHAIIPGTSKNLPNITPKTEELAKKITRLERITNTSVEDMIAKSNGRLSVDQATKNLERAQKELTKVQEKLATVGRTDEAVTGDKTVRITFADEIQSDIFQTYRKHLEQVRDDYQKLLDKGVDVTNPTAVQAHRYNLKTEQDVLEFYNKHKDIMRPIFKTAEDFAAHFTTLKESQKVFKDFAKIKPGTMTQEQLNLVRASGKERDVVLEIFSEAFTNPETLKKLFPNIPFKDRKAWGDAIVKNDLHTAAKRLFIDKDANAAEWYAISPAELIQKRYNQSGTTATALTQRTKDMKGIGTGEFYGGPNVTDPSGKHYTSVLEAALKRAAQINNTEFKIIKVQVSDPKSTKRFINVVDLNGAVVKQFKVGAGDAQDAVTKAMQKADTFITESDIPSLYSKAVEIPSGFKTVDAYAIKLSPEMVLPTKTHFASGGYALYSPLVSMDEMIGAY